MKDGTAARKIINKISPIKKNTTCYNTSNSFTAAFHSILHSAQRQQLPPFSTTGSPETRSETGHKVIRTGFT
jgi:hypothetical protein